VKIVHINTWTVAPGKEQALRQVMRESQEFLAGKRENATRTMMLSMAGPQPYGRFTLITTWESLGDWEKSMERRTTDAEWQALVGKWGDVLVPASRELTIHEVI
jgi:heme-degrading monooxygenase HmoA